MDGETPASLFLLLRLGQLKRGKKIKWRKTL